MTLHDRFDAIGWNENWLMGLLSGKYLSKIDIRLPSVKQWSLLDRQCHSGWSLSANDSCTSRHSFIRWNGKSVTNPRSASSRQAFRNCGRISLQFRLLLLSFRSQTVLQARYHTFISCGLHRWYATSSRDSSEQRVMKTSDSRRCNDNASMQQGVMETRNATECCENGKRGKVQRKYEVE